MRNLYIELFDGKKPCGKYDLPRTIESVRGSQFELQRAVKGGGNGLVFEARPVRGVANAPPRVAVKLLRQQDDLRVARFRNEVRILRMLDSPAIAKFFDEGEIDLGSGWKVPWVAMDLGAANLREHVQTSGVIGVDILRGVASQMCDALEHLHSKAIIHRDIKPDNFVWFGHSVRMIDFGIAKTVVDEVCAREWEQFTQHAEFVGPALYFSPELIAYGANKSQVVDHRSDLFQFGKVLWFVATGTVSCGIPARKSCPVGGGLFEVVLSLLQDDPEDRIQSAAEVKKRLRDALGS